MIKNNTTPIAIMLAIVISGFLVPITAYSQLPYFPKMKSSKKIKTV
jgi:hypothetical protein